MADSILESKPAFTSALLPNLSAGLVLGFSTIIYSVSIASLIFSGPLEPYLPQGIAIVLTTSVVTILCAALLSSLDGVISRIPYNPSIVLAVATASTAGVLGNSPALLPTVLALIAVTTLLTGLSLFLLGQFRLGGLMRYIPYPVIGGFLAGVGWLFIQGSFSATVGYPLSWEALPRLFQPDELPRWIPAVVFGLMLFIGVRRIKHYLALSGLLAVGLIVTAIFLVVSGMSVAQAAERGLVLGPMGELTIWNAIRIDELARADWAAVGGQAGNIGAILILEALTLLLYISSLEIALHRDIDLNHELRVAGVTCVASGLLGGMAGYQDLGYTVLNYRAGAKGRLAGIIAGLLCLTALVIGASLLAYIPRPLLGGLLLFLGLNFLDEWVVQGHKKLGRLDYAIVLVVMLTIAVTNLLAGIGVGLILVVAMFVANYSRANIFHHILTGVEMSSNVERNAYQRRALDMFGRQIYILQLQGFIFFGTAYAVLEEVRARIHAADKIGLLYLILDFRHVTGLDSSAVLSLTRVKELAGAHGFTMVLTNLNDRVGAELERNGLIFDEQMRRFADLDHSLEWCEDQLLGSNMATLKLIPPYIEAQLSVLGMDENQAASLRPYLEHIQLEPGEYLIRQGEPFHDLYFIEVGQVSVYFEREDGKQVRVHTPGTGTIVGELGFYLDVPRSASVIADYKTSAYRLTRRAMQEMKARDPRLAIAFDEMMLRVIAERLVATNRTLRALTR